MADIPTEAWPIIATIVGLIGAGVGKFWSWITQERTRFKLDQQTQVAQDLRTAQERLIEVFKEQAKDADGKLDKSLEGMGALTYALTENTAVQKLMADRIAKIESNQETMIQELRYARRE